MFLQVAKQRKVEPKGLGKVDSLFLKRVVDAPHLKQAEMLLRESEAANYSGLIFLAIALSRRNEWLESEHFVGLISAAAESKEKLDELADALFVIFMFNMINVVANEFGIGPEWNTRGRFLAWRKRMMKFVLPRLVNLTAIESDDSVPVCLKKSFEELNLEWNDIWDLFSQQPGIAIGIQQILFALSLAENETLIDDLKSTGENSIRQVFQKAVRASIDKLNNGRLQSHLESYRLQLTRIK